MRDLKERIVHLAELVQDLKMESPESRVLPEVLNVLKDLASIIEGLQSSQQELAEYVRTVDDDLKEIEDHVYRENISADDIFPEDDLMVLECSNCGEQIYLEENELESKEVFCPNCHEVIYLDEDYSDLEEVYSDSYPEKKRKEF